VSYTESASPGSPNLEFLKAMHAEHTVRGGHWHQFVTPNYKLETTAKDEWLYVAGDENGTRMEPPSSYLGHGRIIRSIDELMEIQLAKDAKLLREEMIAIVMYTGPAFVLYNAVLRRFPEDIYTVFKDHGNLFPTTIFVLVSAINKLSRCMDIPPGTLLYRGLGGVLDFPERFYHPDPACATPNALGFLEFGFMSTTAEKSIAVQYSGLKEGRPKACIMQIRPNSVDRGAEISVFSQYPLEREFLFVPYSFVQGEGASRTEIVDGGGVLTIVPVRININLKTETVEELTRKKKNMHETAFKNVIEESKQWMHDQKYRCKTKLMNRWEQTNQSHQTSLLSQQSKEHSRKAMMSHGLSRKIQERKIDRDIDTFIEETLKQLQDVKAADFDLEDAEYANDLKYKTLVTRMLSLQQWSKEKLQLWIEKGTSIEEMCCTSMKSAHRQWMSLLRKRPVSDRSSTAVELLQCKGLIVNDEDLKAEMNGETLISAAVADGWAFEDLQVWHAHAVAQENNAHLTRVCGSRC
jgi:hypothetical protein